MVLTIKTVIFQTKMITLQAMLHKLDENIGKSTHYLKLPNGAIYFFHKE